MKDLRNFIFNEEGATAIEYGLIAALVAVVVIVALTGAGGELKALFETVEDELTTAGS